ncbi:MAG: sulfate adenylyltransferase subunit CysN [Polyangiales bacterium]
MSDIEHWLRQHEQKELLRFVTIGSVDDGKSTLIGRLLHDADGIFDDQLAAVKRASARGATRDGDGDDIDFSLVTDGLKAEREQGITIDVAYRYFTTEKRKYILADTPGHVQYTRNMATGASTADVAVVLLDARLGVLPQSRRHACIASLLGIRQLLVAVNKMDLVDWSREVFERLRADFAAVVNALGFERVAFVPVSARKGDNVVTRSTRSPWHDGPTILSFLEDAPLPKGSEGAPLRFPVQYVLRPHLNYRGFAGSVASGVVRRGDAVTVLPSGRRSTVAAIDTFEGEVEAAWAPMAVTLRLADEVDVARGDVIAHPGAEPTAARRFEADLVWMSERPMDPSRAYLVKHTTRVVPARVESVRSHLDLETLGSRPADGLALNDIGRVVIRCDRPLLVDPYAESRATGAFIVVDALTNDTVAAGMLRAALDDHRAGDGARSTVTSAERRERFGHAGAVAWVKGDAGGVERALFDRGCAVALVDGAEVGAARVAEALCAAGLVAVVQGDGAATGERDALRRAVGDAAFVTGDGADIAALVTAMEKQGIIAPR